MNLFQFSIRLHPSMTDLLTTRLLALHLLMTSELGYNILARTLYRRTWGAKFVIVTALWVAFSLSKASAQNLTTILIKGEKKNPIFANLQERLEQWEMQMPTEHQTLLQFILDFAIRSKWNQVVLFAPTSSAMLMSCAPAIYGYFNRYGVSFAIHSTSHHLLPMSLYHTGHRLGIALIWHPDVYDFLEKLTELEMLNEYRTWLIIQREVYNEVNIMQQLGLLNIQLDTSTIVCTVVRQMVPTTSPKMSMTTEENQWFSFEKGEPICIEENETEDWYTDVCVTGLGVPRRIKRLVKADPEININLAQIYKISGSDIRSLVVNHFGFWDSANGLTITGEMVPAEKRSALNGHRIIIGMRNTTFSSPSSSTWDNDDEEEVQLEEALDCLLYGLNASRETVSFSKLGWRNEEGGWTHMLGAVVDGVIDFAFDTLNIDVDIHQEMLLTHPILKTMNNIYFKRPDSGGMRDIFLAPFSTNLLTSVCSTGLLLGFSMMCITTVNSRLTREKAVGVENEHSKKEARADDDSLEISGAALWSVSVMCMQGSPWWPTSKSGSLLLIFSLLFALVIYNSYAAFITSVLSVKNVRIKGLNDLIDSHFRFGYTLRTPDEIFLRTVNDSILRELYFKGLRKNDGVNDPVEGMKRAGKGNYAFFVAARTARRALRREVAHSQRCGIREMIIPMTKTVAAIPMSRRSPLKKLINYRVLRLMESGVLHRFQGNFLPPMPKCVDKTKFNSASFSDVYSAFYALISGWLVSALLLFCEILWHRQRILRRKTKQGQIDADKDLAVKSFGMHRSKFKF